MTKRSKILFGGLIGLPLTCGLGGYLISWRQAQELAKEIAMLRAMGVPTSGSELKATTKRKGENAAPYYRSAMAKLKSPGVLSLVQQLGAFDPAFGGSLNTIRPSLRAFEPIWRDLQEASERPDLDFNKDYEKIMWVAFDELSPMRTLAKASSGRARVEAMRGDWKGAIQALRVTARLAHHIGQQPTMISMLVELSLRAIHDSAFEFVVGRFQRDALALNAFRAYVDSLDPLPDMKRGLMGETVFGVQVFEHPEVIESFQSMDDFSTGPDWKHSAMKVPHIRRAVRLQLIRVWRETWEAMPKDGRDWKGIDANLRKAELKVESGSFTGAIVADLMPVFVVGDAWARSLAQRRLAQSSIKLLLERQGGTLLVKLANYGLHSIDPFTGKPLHYRKTATGFVIYSEDANGDQGGVAKSFKGDIVWEIK